MKKSDAENAVIAMFLSFILMGVGIIGSSLLYKAYILFFGDQQ